MDSKELIDAKDKRWCDTKIQQKIKDAKGELLHCKKGKQSKTRMQKKSFNRLSELRVEPQECFKL